MISINVDRSRTDSVSISVAFPAEDLALAFPCENHDAELFFRLMRDCGRPPSEELLTFSQVAKVIETAMKATTLNLAAGRPELDPEN